MADAESDFDTVFQVTTDTTDHHEDISDLQTTSQDIVELVSPCFDTPHNTVHVAPTSTHENKVALQLHNKIHTDVSNTVLLDEKDQDKDEIAATKESRIKIEEVTIKDSSEVATMTESSGYESSKKFEDKFNQTESNITEKDTKLTQTDIIEAIEIKKESISVQTINMKVLLEEKIIQTDSIPEKVITKDEKIIQTENFKEEKILQTEIFQEEKGVQTDFVFITPNDEFDISDAETLNDDEDSDTLTLCDEDYDSDVLLSDLSIQEDL